jgi:hypothetical protein
VSAPASAWFTPAFPVDDPGQVNQQADMGEQYRGRYRQDEADRREPDPQRQGAVGRCRAARSRLRRSRTFDEAPDRPQQEIRS